MKILFRILIVFLVVNALLMCNRTGGEKTKETIITGVASVTVDETLLPILQDQKLVFESVYDAQIDLVAKSETEAVKSLLDNNTQILVLARNLYPEELKFLNDSKRFPKITPFAKDAVVLIANKARTDSTVALSEVLDFMKGAKGKSFEGLVFDNPNSGTVQFMNKLAGLKTTPENGVYSFKTNAEVMKFVAENPHMIGVVGLNWLNQPDPVIQSYLKNIRVLDVQPVGKQIFVSPSQNNLAEGTYPLARQLYFVNAQGYDGLGMGFASFIAGERGQRIVLQSGLLPERMPSRKIVTRKSL